MIKRFYATKDNTITNAFDAAGSRGTSANMGASDILEVFSIFGQTSGSTGYSTEEARILVEFDINEVSADTTIPSNAKYFLKLFNAEHGATVPRNYQLEAHSVDGSWEEGIGLDMDNYLDLSYGLGSNWTNREGSTAWGTEGGDLHPSPSNNQDFDTGLEDLSIDVTDQVNEWLGSRDNHGFMVKLPTSFTDGSQSRSFYTKKFFARGSEFFHKRPCLEVRWNSAKQDNRINFYTSSSLSPDNSNTLYLYNYHRGQLVDIPGVDQGEIYVDLYATLGSSAETLCVDTPATGGWIETGIYTASVCVETTASTLYDVWHDGTTQFHTGTIEANNPAALNQLPDGNYVVSVSNRQDEYRSDQVARFQLYIRSKNWSPSIYTVASTTPTSEVLENLHFKIVQSVTQETVIDYDTTDNSTLLSYDSKGNYFDLDINMLEPNHAYEISLASYNVATKAFDELPFKHKFRVVNNEY